MVSPVPGGVVKLGRQWQPPPPWQIAALNEVFTPSTDQVARARRIIAEFETADTDLLVIDGKLIEKPALRDMYRIVVIADRTGGQVRVS